MMSTLLATTSQSSRAVIRADAFRNESNSSAVLAIFSSEPTDQAALDVYAQCGTAILPDVRASSSPCRCVEHISACSLCPSQWTVAPTPCSTPIPPCSHPFSPYSLHLRFLMIQSLRREWCSRATKRCRLWFAATQPHQRAATSHSRDR